MPRRSVALGSRGPRLAPNGSRKDQKLTRKPLLLLLVQISVLYHSKRQQESRS